MGENLTGALLFLAMIYGPIFALAKYQDYRENKEKEAAAERQRRIDVQMNRKMEQHYNPPDWKYRRLYVLARDNHRCIKCGSPDSPHVHHVVPRHVRIDHSAGNLVTLCNVCHGAEHNTVFETNEKRSSRWHIRKLASDGRHVKARISHRCDACGGSISKGQVYVLITRGSLKFSIRDQYPGGAKLCSKCMS